MYVFASTERGKTHETDACHRKLLVEARDLERVKAVLLARLDQLGEAQLNVGEHLGVALKHA
jgi:hypothetical protein